jgi:hypothetical protein
MKEGCVRGWKLKCNIKKKRVERTKRKKERNDKRNRK